MKDLDKRGADKVKSYAIEISFDNIKKIHFMQDGSKCTVYIEVKRPVEVKKLSGVNSYVRSIFNLDG